MNRLIYLSIFVVVASFAILSLASDSTTEGSDKIEVTIESPRQNVRAPGHRNIVSAAVRGAGKLAWNVTSETAQFAGTVVRGAADLVKHTVRAGIQAVIASMNRIRGKHLLPSSSTTVTMGDTPAAAAPVASDELKNVQADELHKTEEAAATATAAAA